MLDWGTKVVAGVTPGRGGQEVEGVRVFDAVDEAVRRKRANASIVFVPAAFAKDAVIEAVEGRIRLIAVITGRHPVHDALEVPPYARSKAVTVIGPQCAQPARPRQSNKR